MDFHGNQLIVPGICYGAGLGTAWLFGLKGKISDIVLSRSGFRIHTNSGMVVYDVMNQIEQIDSTAKKAMRKATEMLTILPPESDEISTEVELINMKANMPLWHSSFENHHTRELLLNGANAFMEDKTNEVISAVRRWEHKYPDLPQLAENLVLLWVKNALVPSIRKACNSKLEFYRKLYKQESIIDSLKVEIQEWIDKNEKYVECIRELSECSGIPFQSSIIHQPSIS